MNPTPLLASLTRLDLHLSARAATWEQRKSVRWSATCLAHSGDSIVWVLLGGALLWAELSARLPELPRGTGARVLLAIVFASTVSTTLKLLVQRARPPGPRGGFYLQSDQHSFPSGHAVRAGALSVVLGQGMPLGVQSLWLLWALSVCVSRVVLGVHFWGDVVAGLGCGYAIGALVSRF